MCYLIVCMYVFAVLRTLLWQTFRLPSRQKHFTFHFKSFNKGQQLFRSSGTQRIGFTELIHQIAYLCLLTPASNTRLSLHRWYQSNKLKTKLIWILASTMNFNLVCSALLLMNIKLLLKITNVANVFWTITYMLHLYALLPTSCQGQHIDLAQHKDPSYKLHVCP